jgi:creatinine amidohydrolase
MTEPSGPIILSELTSAGFAAALEHVEAVLIPIGAHEQHGPALPVSTDTLSAQVVSALAATMMAPRVAVAPAIPWGVSWHHMGFPGTISLREETLMAIVEDVVGSLHRHGVRRFILVNTHGGNNAALQMVAESCHRELGVPVVASIFAYALIADAASEVIGPESVGHGGGDETSVILATRPELVVRNALGPRSVREDIRRAQVLVRAAGGVLPVAQHVVSESGATGDSTNASAAAGATMLGQVASKLRVIIEELLDLDLNSNGPR